MLIKVDRQVISIGKCQKLKGKRSLIPRLLPLLSQVSSCDYWVRRFKVKYILRKPQRPAEPDLNFTNQEITPANRINSPISGNMLTFISFYLLLY